MDVVKRKKLGVAREILIWRVNIVGCCEINEVFALPIAYLIHEMYRLNMAVNFFGFLNLNIT